MKIKICCNCPICGLQSRVINIQVDLLIGIAGAGLGLIAGLML